MARLSMLIDLTRCIGCDACTVACKQENGTPMDTFFARVLNVEAGTYPNVKRIYIPVLCNHCDDAPCLKGCPNKAIVRRPDGIVLVDQDRCKGTGACVSACPYGNIVLSKADSWYLTEGERYEKDFVKPRLKQEVARKCTYCAHRVDEGLEPACVVACPTNARIFGDLDDPESKVSAYIDEQQEKTGRRPFHLLPQAGTKPATCYLGTMAEQSTSTMGGRAGLTHAEPLTPAPERAKELVGARPSFFGRLASRLSSLFLVVALLLLSGEAFGQTAPVNHEDLFSTSPCIGCHGQSAMGGLGPPLVKTQRTLPEYMQTVRQGKGMMPGTPASALSDESLQEIYQELQKKPWIADQIPISYKVGQFLTTANVFKIFSVVFLVAFLFALKVLFYWLKAAGLGALWPRIGKIGYIKAAWIAFKSLVVDGFLVISLWKRNRFRWAMHGLILYGFFGLMLADVLMSIFNPARSELPLSNPLKLLPVLAGLSVFVGVMYVQYRYRTDKYIDNGLTLGRDFLFVNLLFHTLVSGFLTVMLKRAHVSDWVMPIYLYHLTAMATLIVSAPFTRFAHAFIVPALVALTRVTEAVTEGGVDLGFEREPMPGRHHKSERIAAHVLSVVDPDSTAPIRLRYYP